MLPTDGAGSSRWLARLSAYSGKDRNPDPREATTLMTERTARNRVKEPVKTWTGHKVRQSKGPVPFVSASPEMNREARGDRPGKVNEDVPEENCPAAWDDGNAAADPALNADDRTVHEVGLGAEGEEGTEPETGQDAPCSAMDVVAVWTW